MMLALWRRLGYCIDTISTCLPAALRADPYPILPDDVLTVTGAVSEVAVFFQPVVQIL